VSERHRGNAVPETALVISFTLLVLYGTIQLATTAFYQMSADGATFVAAHDTVASVGDPTNANLAAAATSGSGAFDKIVKSSISALNPSSSTFEADVAQQVPGITELGGTLPLTINSRLIEASAGTAAPSPISNCAQGALNVTNGLTGLITNAPVGLLQGGALTSVGSFNGAPTSTVNLNTAALTSRVAALSNVTTALNGATGLVPTLKTIPSLITSLASIPIVGSILAPILTPLQTAIATDLQGPIAQAMAGTFSATSALATVNSELTSQIPSLGSLLATVIDPIVLTGGSAATGILGANGPLAQLSSAMSALKTIDSGSVTCP
jgi:hypothetical protein